jgi:acetyl esterase/lipase
MTKSKRLRHGAIAFLLTLVFASFLSAPRVGAAEPSLETYGVAPDGAILQWYVYRPRGKGPWPVALLIHGGGFHGGGPNDENLVMAAQDLADAGYMALAITYRLDAQFIEGQTSDGGIPQQTDDCKRAVSAARKRADCNGKVVAVGGSAGGSHAAFLALTGRPGVDQLDAAVCLSAALDFSDWRDDPNIVDFKQNVQTYCRVPSAEPPSPETVAILRSASPAWQPFSAATVPPMFLIASANDPMPHTQLPDMVAALRAAGVTVTTYPVQSHYQQLIIPGDLHEFAYWSTPDPTVKNATIAFLNAALQSTPPTPTPTLTPTPTPTPTVSPSPTPAPAQLLNISSRLQVQTGERVLVAGFIVTGETPKKVLIRGLGPSLTGAGIVLTDPVLQLFSSNPSSLLTTNDNWKSSQQTQIIATGIPPPNDLESALVVTLDPGSYTAILSGKNGGTGVGLLELYDLNPSAGSHLANISTRGFVQTGDNVVIGGFILGNGSGQNRVLVRAIGPSLASLSVAGSLTDPTLALRNADGTLVASNDNWRTSQQAVIVATGAAPSDDRESAIVATLPPGNYTAVVAGANGTTGVALVEIYDLP